MISRRGMLAGMAGASALAALPDVTRAAAGNDKVDVIVVGAGVFGAWTAWNLQKRGQSVLLVDAWGPSHSRASSGGETRLIRTEYGGDPLYTRGHGSRWPNGRRSRSVQRASIFHQVGALYIYPEDVEEIARSMALQRSLGIPIEKLGVPEMKKRWPQIDFTGIEVGVLQPTMGALMARRGVQTLVTELEKAGGRYRQFAVSPPRAGGRRSRRSPGPARERRARRTVSRTRRCTRTASYSPAVPGCPGCFRKWSVPASCRAGRTCSSRPEAGDARLRIRTCPHGWT